MPKAYRDNSKSSIEPRRFGDLLNFRSKLASERPNVVRPSTEGKGPAIAGLAPQKRQGTIVPGFNPDPPNRVEDIFALASQLEAILSGQSYRTCLKVMNMVGSLHGIRAIPEDRPIGRSSVGTTRVEPVPRPAKKGQQPSRAGYKKSAQYIELSSKRDSVVATIKSLTDGESKDSAISELRRLERELKALKALKSGNV
jgi:hypothetical protein